MQLELCTRLQLFPKHSYARSLWPRVNVTHTLSTAGNNECTSASEHPISSTSHEQNYQSFAFDLNESLCTHVISKAKQNKRK